MKIKNWKGINKHAAAEMSILPGRVYVLIGENSAGKTMLLRSLMAMVHPGETVYETENGALTELEWKEQTAYVPQEMTAYQKTTLRQAAELHQIVCSDWSEGHFTHFIESFGLELNKPLDQLSGGKQKLAGCALALSRNTSLLVMDEPFAGVDFPGQQKLKEACIDWLEEDESRSIVYTSHQAGDIQDLGDYIYPVLDGTVLPGVEKDSLMQEAAFVWLKEESGNQRSTLFVEQKRQGQLVQGVTFSLTQLLEELQENNSGAEHIQNLSIGEALDLYLQHQRRKTV
ncbi:ATP-binding cassette domain-containing protein [Alkalicoccus urumqiensis]|uniref:ABC transporter domain-containing protein n=1 Tax=Alkalicoccus urumqiensis TaxID=1548213 RepID=A0A2P6MGS3_ALKUR|nr:ATP-binding cassette domain-containing protein [Alkalicoccus urumqiensis]PRO65486.1 hypothetical protein C6I21_10050 [Alkalicoccus urumqiensis]